MQATMRVGGDATLDVEELVRTSQKGDAASFAALYEHFSDRIFRYVSFKTGNPAEAEDITEDVFVRMLESIHSFKWQGHPYSSWLFHIAHNLVVDHYRKKGRNRTLPLEEAAVTTDDYSSDLESHAELNLSMREVRGAMKSLTDLQREVISLRFAAGLSVAETGPRCRQERKRCESASARRPEEIETHIRSGTYHTCRDTASRNMRFLDTEKHSSDTAAEEDGRQDEGDQTSAINGLGGWR